MAIDPVARARALLGLPFRPQARERELGVDCAGLTILAFDLPINGFRRTYRLRGDHRAELAAALHPFFRRIARPRRQSGDLLLLAPAPDQLHLAIQTPLGFVHADAGLGRVVETPSNPRWPLRAVYRRRVRPLKERD